MSKAPLDGPRQVDLYASHEPIHVRQVSGFFSQLRLAIRWGGFALLLALPWLSWNGEPLLRLDLPARQFQVLGLTFFPQDFMLVSWLLIIGAFALFTFTNWLGRVWCGYVCFQSVWFSLFMDLERWVEGSRNKRIRLGKASWGGEKVRLRALKWLLWALLAGATALSIMGLFVPIEGLLQGLATFSLTGWTAFWLGFFAFMTFLMGGIMREQACLYMCPYARFQSAMFDPDTLIVSYDAARGEPRSAKKRAAEGAGDCVDCSLCVQVCPTGIDIRNGLQYECISCAQCIDACDSVMDKLHKPRGLIRYTTEHDLAGKPSKTFRPRLIGYAVVLLAMISAVAIATANRVPLELQVLRDRGSLYERVTTAGGALRIENVYTVRVVNKDRAPRTVTLAVTGLPGLTLDGPQTLELAGQEVRTEVIRLLAPPPAAPNQELRFTLTDTANAALTVERESRFLAPGQRP